MTVLSVDPGLWKTGCALWSSEGQLLKAWTQRQGKSSEVGPTLWRRMALSIKEEPCVLVIEVMQVDGRTRGKEKDLFSLSGVIGAISVRFSSAKIVPTPPLNGRALSLRTSCGKESKRDSPARSLQQSLRKLRTMPGTLLA